MNNQVDYLFGVPCNTSDAQRPVFSATAGQKVRVAIAWRVAIDGPSGNYTFHDVDLMVQDINRTLTWLSTSFDNNYEIVEFIAPQTGQYTIYYGFKPTCADYPIPIVSYAYYKQ